MFAMLRHAAVAVILLGLAVPSAWAQSRLLAVDDIVSLEAFGRASISPDGRWAVYEKQAAYDTAPSFDYGNRSTWAITTLWLVDLSRPRVRPELLLPQEGPGLLRATWSPSGERLAVWRFRDGRLEIGIVSMADQSVIWTGLTPEIPMAGADTAWTSEDTVALIVRPDGSLPAILRYYGGSQTRIAEAWERTRLGREPSRTVIETHGGVASAEAPEPPQALVLLNVVTGARRVLAEGRIADFAVSPDRRRLAVLEGGAAVPVGRPALLQAQGAYRHRLFLLDLDGSAPVRPIEGLDVAPHLLRWSADSRDLLVWARVDGETWEEGGLVRIGEGGATEVATPGLRPGTGAQILRGVRADWSGSTPVIRAQPAQGGRWDWYGLPAGAAPLVLTSEMAAVPAQIAAIDESSLLFFADGGLWTTSASASSARRLTQEGIDLRLWTEPDPDRVMRLKVNAPPRRAWAMGQTTNGRSAVVSAAGEVRLSGLADGETVRTLAASEDGSLMLARAGFEETLRLQTAAGEADLDRVNADLADVALVQPLAVRHADAFGRPAESWLFLPEGGAAAARGLIVEVYPGAVDDGGWYGPGRLTYGFRAAVAAGAGFAVLTPAIPIDRPDAVGAAYYAQSVDLAVDAALAAFEDLPGDRMAILGHSFGGHAALGIAARSSRYRSYVISSAAIDQFGEWGEFIPATRVLPEDGLMMVNQQGWVEAGQGAVGASPWDDPQAYIDRSPYLTVDRITAPILLMTADRDYVPMSQMERAFSALFRLGGDARLVTYWGEHHHVLSPANIRDRYAQIFAWLDRTLSGPPAVTPTPKGVAPRPEPNPRTPPRR